MKQRRYKCLSVRATTNCFRVRSITEIHCLPLLRHLRMKLAFHSWRLVQKMPLTSNKLSWLCLLTSRTGLPFFPNHHKIPSLIYVKKCKLPPTFMASLSFYSLVSCFIEHLVFFFFFSINIGWQVNPHQTMRGHLPCRFGDNLLLRRAGVALLSGVPWIA